MQGVGMLDIRPLIANDQWAVRWCFCLALMVFGIGLLMLGVFVLAYLKSPGEFRDLEKIGGFEKVGAAVGPIVSLVGLVPFKLLLTRLDRLRILRALQAWLDKPETEVREEDLKRVRKLLWDMYERDLLSDERKSK
jgi:hypothetical protein